MATVGLGRAQSWLLYSTSKNVGGNSDETGRQMLQDASGNIFTLSTSGTGLVVAKRDSSGNPTWRSFFHAEPSGLALTPDGGVVVAGRVDRGNAPLVREIITLKYDASGGLAWMRTQVGATAQPEAGMRAYAAPDGSIYVGATVNQDAFSDVSLIKYSSNGDLQWQRTNGPNPDQEVCLSVQPDGAGNIYLFANRNPSGSGLAIIYKYAPDGSLLWNYAATVSGVAGNIAVDATGACYIPANGGNPGAIKVNANGTQAWKTSLGLTNAPLAIAVQGTTPFVAGTQTGLFKSFVQKLGVNGGIVWTATHTGPNNEDEALNSIGVASDGSIYASGNRMLSSSAGIFTMKVAPAGTVAWAVDHGVYTYTPPLIPPAPPVPPPPLIYTSLAINGAGQPVTLSTINGPDSSTGYDTQVSVDSTSGALAASSSLDLNGTHETVIASATDSQGTSYVLADSQQGGGADAALQQFNPDGSLGWLKGFGGNGPDLAYALAIAPGGGVVVSYGVFNSNTKLWDTRVRRYDSAGTALWTTALTGSNHVASMTCGADGAIYLVGQDQSILPFRFQAAKLNSSGALLWSTVFPGVGPADDYPFKIALDASGNLFVCGNLWDGTRYLATLQRYNPTTGEVLWTNTYASSGAGASGLTMVPGSSGSSYLLGTDWAAGGRGLIRRYDLSGNLMFSRISSDPDLISERYVSATIDTAGNLVVGGSAVKPDKNVDLLAAKFNSNGILTWKRLYDGPANLNDNGKYLVIDALGGIYVAGNVSGGASGRDSVIWRLNADGTSAWPDSGDGYTNGAILFDSGRSVGDAVGGLAADTRGFAYMASSYIGTGGTFDLNSTKFGPTVDAVFLSQVVPATMVAGQSYYVSLTFANTSGTTWTQAAGFELGSLSPVDNTTWGLNRVALGASESIAPGQDKKFSSFRVFAPTIAGTYNFQWSMRQNGIGPFGQPSTNVPVVVSVASNAARYVGQTSPSTVKAGTNFNATVRMRNVGSGTWTVSGGYGLAASNSSTNWNITLASVGTNIAPGQEKQFSLACKAPTTPGTYTFRFQMRRTAGFFGDVSASKTIVVTP